MGNRSQGLPVETEHGRIGGPAEARGTLDHGVQHRLETRRRGADDPEDLGRGRLLLERLGQLPVPRLEFLEEPHVLDRDHRLIGKGPEKLDLTGRERPGHAASDRNRSDRGSVSQHGHADHASHAQWLSQRLIPILGIRLEVGRLHDHAVDDGSHGHQSPVRPGPNHAPQLLHDVGRDVVRAGNIERLPVHDIDGAE
jgi:hypothetical protein